MKIISFNINGLRARLHQLDALIRAHQPDIIGLQEIKVHDDQFPLQSILDLGYHAYFHGQKAHYGVAFLTKNPLVNVQKGFASDTELCQRRMIIGQMLDSDNTPITVLNGYFPQGESIIHPSKFPNKRKFYQDLMTHLRQYTPDEKVIVMGDFNISPTDLDIGIGEINRKRWLKSGKCSFQPEEREWFDKLLEWGLIDLFRAKYPAETGHYSWFDYRSDGFSDRRGLRIDGILATAPLAQRCSDAGIDLAVRAMEKPSDHAPVWAKFQ
ncbi:MAG: exodeoxyribonuclease III [Enterovibrio sp.]